MRDLQFLHPWEAVVIVAVLIGLALLVRTMYRKYDFQDWITCCRGLFREDVPAGVQDQRPAVKQDIEEQLVADFRRRLSPRDRAKFDEREQLKALAAAPNFAMVHRPNLRVIVRPDGSASV